MESAAEERHYTPKEVAKLWGISVSTATRILERTEGVLRISIPTKLVRTRRPRTLLRCPASVLERLHQDRSRGLALLAKVQRPNRVV